MTGIRSQALLQERYLLSRELRQLRNDAKVTGTLLAEKCGFSQSKLSKIETGHLIPSRADLEALLLHLSVPKRQASQLEARRAALSTEAESWRLLHLSGFAKHQERIAEIERSVGRISIFQTALIPGLLQTPAYATAVIARAMKETPSTAAVEARMTRKNILEDRSKEFAFVLTEAALRCRYTDETNHRLQLQSLFDFAARPNIDIRVVTFDCVLPVIPLHAFVILGMEVVTVESFQNQISVFEEEIASFVSIFSDFQSVAVPLLECRLSNYAEATLSRRREK